MIRFLNKDDKEIIKEAFISTGSFMGRQRTIEETEIFLQIFDERVNWSGQRWYGNFNDDGKLMSFLRFWAWDDNLEDGSKSYSVGAAISSNLVQHKKTYHPIWSDDVIDLYNAGCADFELQGRTIAWGRTATKANWVDWRDVEACSYSKYKKTIITTLPNADTTDLKTSELYVKPEWLAATGGYLLLPIEMYLVKLEKQNDQIESTES